MKQSTVLYVALVLLLLVGPLMWILTDEPLSTGPPATGPGSAAAPPRTKPAAPPRGPRTSRSVAESPRDPGPPAAPALTEAPKDEASAPTPAPRVLLRVALDGLDNSVPAASSVVEVVRERDRGDASENPPSVSAYAGPGAKFDVDVSPLGPEGARRVELSILVDRPGYLPAAAQASVRAPQRGAAQPEVEHVRVQLRVAGWAAGVVQDLRFARVAGADVGAFVRQGSRWVRVDATRTDAEGCYRLRLVPGDANLVVAAAEGTEPSSVQATGVSRAESRLSPFTLRAGLAISGTIRFPDGRAVPGARIGAMPTWATSDLALGAHRLAYRGGQILDCPAGAAANAGLFRLSGLLPGEYELWIAAPGIAPDLLALQRRRASPPYEGLPFVVDGGTLVIEVSCSGRPVPRVPVAVVAAGESGATPATTDSRGLTRVLVLPGAPYSVEVAAPGFDPESRAAVGPRAGDEARVSVHLVRRIAAPSLELLIAQEPSASGDEVESADVRLHFIAEPPSDSLWIPEYERPTAELPDLSETVVFDRGVARMTGLWAGAYRVVALPRPEGFRLPAETRVALRDGAVTRAKLVFPRGGRLRVAARDASGRPVAAAFRVIAKHGAEVASGDANSDAGPLLRPAAYTVEVTRPRCVPVTRPVSIPPDAVLTLEVELPEPRTDR